VIDEELKTYLEAKFAETREFVDTRIDAAFTRFSQHVLHEVGIRFDEVNVRLASIDSRLKLQGGLIQAGSRAIARLSTYAEDSEARWVDLTVRVAAMEERLRKIDQSAA
jgi:hypothetical protein